MSAQPHPHHRLALGLALATVVVWGGNFTLQKHLLHLLEPSGVLLLRYLITAVAALLLLRLSGGRWWPQLSRSELGQMLWLGVLGHTLHVGVVVHGVHLSTPFSSAILLASGPLFTLLLLRWQRAERLQPAQLIGVLLALLGMLMFLSDKLLGGQWRAGGGDLVLLMASIFYSVYTVQAQPVMLRHGALTTMGCSTLLGSLPLIAWTLPTAGNVPWQALTGLDWLGLWWAVLVSGFGGWLAWGWINTQLGVARTAPLLYLIPPVAGVFAWALMGEHYSWIKLLGALVILLGVALAQYAAVWLARWR